ncbi:division/cell wall cluster transcriptional repressor MraZ [Nocardioides sp. GY 10127]|uniref:division/cell wall cluster transcriptional repressor MraZ n=1 Tax=Nocardioides sp. GY 10127 TaxID=2569762 RepID=UPI0010A80D5C|nr:division/cell wall cluster transcriptional repressor MraZ [Nocardioides sp. GY 10127]TIC80971.1 division/cell wall cluster transcriptional repressor MraZ [Nocardioides sp. GY 10127]
MFFLGTHTPRLDEKGRLVLPAKFRDALQEGLVITQGQEHCLTVWPQDGFMAEAARVQSKPMTNKDSRDYRRVLFAGAEQVVPDKQGRIGIPLFLRAAAGLSKDVVVTGIGDRLEIWDPERWAEYRAGAQARFYEVDEGADAD